MASMDHQPPPKRAKVEEEAVEEALAVRQDSRGVKAAAADAAAEQAEGLGAALPNATIDRMSLWRVPKLSDSASPGCQSKSVPNTAGWGQTTAFAADAPDPAPVPRAGYNQLLGDDNVIVADIVRKPYASASDSGESRAFLRAGPRHTLHFDPKVIPTPSNLLDRISPIFPPFFLVFCAFSPSRRGGSNEPQAGTQGQETAGKGTKRGELPPSFDTPGAVGDHLKLSHRKRTRASWLLIIMAVACWSKPRSRRISSVFSTQAVKGRPSSHIVR